MQAGIASRRQAIGSLQISLFLQLRAPLLPQRFAFCSREQPAGLEHRQSVADARLLAHGNVRACAARIASSIGSFKASPQPVWTLRQLDKRSTRARPACTCLLAQLLAGVPAVQLVVQRGGRHVQHAQHRGQHYQGLCMLGTRKKGTRAR